MCRGLKTARREEEKKVFYDTILEEKSIVLPLNSTSIVFVRLCRLSSERDAMSASCGLFSPCLLLGPRKNTSRKV